MNILTVDRNSNKTLKLCSALVLVFMKPAPNTGCVCVCVCLDFIMQIICEDDETDQTEEWRGYCE